MENNYILPSVKDFKKFGKFYNLPKIDVYSDLPLLILCSLNENYIFNPKIIPQETLEKIKLHCSVLQELAKHEDFIRDCKDTHELQIRRLEDKLLHFYLYKIDENNKK